MAAVCETTANHVSAGCAIEERLVYPVAPDLLVAVDASGVDPQQHRHAVTGPLGYFRSGDTGVG